MLSILAFIIVLGVLIFVHELGHFMTAKMADIEVPRFSIGFGPRVIGFKRGETEYVISLLPLGGYVKMAGMEEMEQIEGGPATVNDTIGADTKEELEAMAERPHRPRDFEAKSLPWRALVISAGVIMNVLFAFFVFSFVGWRWGVPADPGTVMAGVSEELLTAETAPLAAIEPGTKVVAVNGEPVSTMRDLALEIATARAGTTRLSLDDGREISFELPADNDAREQVIRAFEPAIPFPAHIGTVVADGAGAKGGIKPGDLVIGAAGDTVPTWRDLVAIIERSEGRPIPLIVLRDGQRVELTVTPEVRTLDSGLTVARLGIGPIAPPVEREPTTLRNAFAYGAAETWGNASLVIEFLGDMFTGKQSPRNIGGPIMIATVSGEVAKLGIDRLLAWMAILSINLAVLNLLPIPVLDGGHLVFLGIEAVRGRPLSLDARMKATQVGFVIIILLMTWAIGNDLLRSFGV